MAKTQAPRVPRFMAFSTTSGAGPSMSPRPEGTVSAGMVRAILGTLVEWLGGALSRS